MEIEQRLNEVLVKLFRLVNSIEEQAVKTEEYKNITTNDMHVIEAIGIGSQKARGYYGNSDNSGKRPGEKGICRAGKERRGQACRFGIFIGKRERGICAPSEVS